MANDVNGVFNANNMKKIGGLAQLFGLLGGPGTAVGAGKQIANTIRNARANKNSNGVGRPMADSAINALIRQNNPGIHNWKRHVGRPMLGIESSNGYYEKNAKKSPGIFKQIGQNIAGYLRPDPWDESPVEVPMEHYLMQAEMKKRDAELQEREKGMNWLSRIEANARKYK